MLLANSHLIFEHFLKTSDGSGTLISLSTDTIFKVTYTFRWLERTFSEIRIQIVEVIFFSYV